MPRKKKQNLIAEPVAEEVALEKAEIAMEPDTELEQDNIIVPAEQSFHAPVSAVAVLEQEAVFEPARKKTFLALPKPALAGVLAVVVMAAVGVYSYLGKDGANTEPIQTRETVLDAGEQARQEALAVIENAAKIIKLPEGEEPNIATVVDLAPLKGQAFFELAALGDKALVYARSGKAFLYRPSENKIIEVGAFDPLATAGDVKVLGAKTDQQNLTVEIRNGSGVSGAGAKVKSKLPLSQGFTVTSVGNAAVSAYPDTIIIGLKSSANSELVKKLSSVLGARITGVLPEGEKPSNADVLVIVGKN